MHNFSPLSYRYAALNRPTATVHCNYIPLPRLSGYLAEFTGKILAVIGFGGKTLDIPPLPCLRVEVATPPLGDTKLVEVWTSLAPILHRKHGDIHYAVSGDVLFGSIRLPESDETTMDLITCTAYRHIFDLLRKEAYPHLIRVWNYVPDINNTTNGLERYQLFCLGRHRAFSERSQFFEHNLPAASAIGVCRGDLHIHFLAARQAGRQIENPRQVSAFHYPRCYGPRSPSFSRAVSKKWNETDHLYISGTASIVGHESRHQGDLLGQLEETLCNIESLLNHARQSTSTDCGSLNNLSAMKVYIRHVQDYGQIKRALEERVGHEMPAMYLQADICRNELLIEIEAIGHTYGN